MITILLDSSAVGGIETHVATLARCLRSAGFEPRVLLLKDHGPHPLCDRLDSVGIAHDSLDGSLRALVAALRTDRGGVLHTHGYKANIFGRLAAWLTGTPCVSTYHAGERGVFPVNAYQQLDTLLSFGSERLCVSAQIRAQFWRKPRLVRNFLPAAPDQHDTKKMTGRPAHIAFIGRVSAEKAPDRFCQIAAALHSAGDRRFSFHLYGSGPELANLRPSFADVVTFHGFLRDVEPVLAQTDMLIIPSRAEGLPMVALEALSQGVPLIATPVGDLPELVVPGQPGALARGDPLEGCIDGLQRWVDLPEAAKRTLGQSARAHLAAHFSAARWLPEIIQAYADAGWKDASGADGAPSAAMIATAR